MQTLIYITAIICFFVAAVVLTILGSWWFIAPLLLACWPGYLLSRKYDDPLHYLNQRFL